MTTITVVAGRGGAGCELQSDHLPPAGVRGEGPGHGGCIHIVTIPDTGHIVPSGPRIPTAATDTNAHNTLA